MHTNESPPKFNIGICMAGAVSAGAYTAGVMDYLLEALDAYEKQRGKDGIPCHQVVIPAMGGASAGGMTSIITAAALQQGIVPVKTPNADIEAERKENLLYHSWVDLTDKDMFARMLETDDVKKEVVSVLNCRFIDSVANRALLPKDPNTIHWQKLPSFCADRLRIFTTLSNLEGFTYDVTFNSAASTRHNPYYIQFHNDYACFELLRNRFAVSSKGWMPLNVETGLNAAVAKDAAMATGAFPIGLKAREVTRTAAVVNNNPFFDEETRKAIKVGQNPYKSLNVDGGMINNEPFDKVRQLLTEVTGDNNYEDYKKFKSTILMIAPFPSTKPSSITLGAQLLHVTGLTLSAMLSQMRSKPAQVKDAMSPECAGQYMIDPSRKITKADGSEFTRQGEKAIACGALSGFSGFLNKEFRIHDYFLGRHNCKIFLKEYFTIPDKDKNDNPIFAKGYEGVSDPRFRASDGSWQIIPIVDAVNYDFPVLNFKNGKGWPRQKWEDISKYKRGLKKRIQVVILNMTSYQPFTRFFIWVGARFVMRRLFANAILSTLKEELDKWDLMIK